MPAGRTAGIFYFMVMRVTMMCISCSVLRKKRVKMLSMLKCADVFGRNTSCMSRHVQHVVITPQESAHISWGPTWLVDGCRQPGRVVIPRIRRNLGMSRQDPGVGNLGMGGSWRGLEGVLAKTPPNPPRPLKTPKTAPKPRF